MFKVAMEDLGGGCLKRIGVHPGEAAHPRAAVMLNECRVSGGVLPART